METFFTSNFVLPSFRVLIIVKCNVKVELKRKISYAYEYFIILDFEHNKRLFIFWINNFIAVHFIHLLTIETISRFQVTTSFRRIRSLFLSFFNKLRAS